MNATIHHLWPILAVLLAIAVIALLVAVGVAWLLGDAD